MLIWGCDRPSTPSIAAAVGEWHLASEELADLLVLGQPLSLDSITAMAVVREWVSLAAMAQRTGDPELRGPEAVQASLWLEHRQALLDAHRELRFGPVPEPSPEEAQEVFEADSLVLLAHTVRRIDQSSSSEERGLQRRTAEAMLEELLEGGLWPEAVARSEDVDSRSQGGLVGLFPPEELPPAFRATGRLLLPGQVSGVVESQEGFHLLYRPSWEEVEDLFPLLMHRRLQEEADAQLNEAVQASLGLEVKEAHVSHARRILEQPSSAWSSQAVVLAWPEGALSEGVLARYALALPEETRRGLVRAPPHEVEALLRQLSVREFRVQGARTAGVVVNSQRLDDLAALHADDLAAWEAALTPGDVPPSSQAAVRRYMERLVARRTDVAPIPPLFTHWLLEPLEWSIHPAGVNAAIELAREMVFAAGSRDSLGEDGP